MKAIVRDCTPPALANIIRRFIDLKYDNAQHSVVWNSKYSTWDEALAASTGSDSENILQKVKDSTLKVKYGEAVFERDSVIFDKIQYSVQKCYTPDFNPLTRSLNTIVKSGTTSVESSVQL